MNTNSEKKYPVSEQFISPQGEGVYAGATMAFIRLAGCTVGKRYPPQAYAVKSSENQPFSIPGFPIYTEECTSYDGRKFACDTDYRVKERLTANEITAHIPSDIRRVCITGGEPCMHDLSPLLVALFALGKKIHLETSGTILFDTVPVWVTVSPKFNYLPEMIERADELKLLVDKDFNPDLFLEVAEKKPVFLHPINEEHTVNPENLQMCMDWQKRYPCFRVGVQLHKAISMLTNQHVR